MRRTAQLGCLLKGVGQLNKDGLTEGPADYFHPNRDANGGVFTGDEASGNHDRGETRHRAQHTVTLLLGRSDFAH